MTCIVGLLDGSKVYIGGDTLGSNGWTGQEVNHSKVFRVNSFVIGGTTSFRMLDLLEYSFSPPEPYPDEDLDRYMRTTFVNKVRSTLKDGGFNQTKDTWRDSGGTFIVGFKDRLWVVQDDYSVLNYKPYCAVGSGYQVAMGSLFTTNGTEMKPEDRVRKALEAASKYVVSVNGPFNVLST